MRKRPRSDETEQGFGRLDRPPSLLARVEQLLRQAIAEGRFPGGKLPTEVELADQLGVSRETVRLAAEVLQREGLLVKVRRRGTFVQPVRLPTALPARESAVLGYIQASYRAAEGQEEAVTRVVAGLMLQGALEEAAAAGFRLAVQQAPYGEVGKVFVQLHQESPLRGVIFASYGEEKPLRRAASLGLPTVLLDHDLHLSGVHGVRDDSAQGAREAVRHLASLGHRHIAFVNWRQADLNPWRLRGFREALREAGLPRRRAWELSGEITEAGARQATTAFLALAPRPSALYCFNNTLARLVLEELRRCGVAVPGEVSVMGGGGEEVPGLACHQADWHVMGRTAVRLLLGHLADPALSGGEHQLCPHTIRPGPTAAAPMDNVGGRR